MSASGGELFRCVTRRGHVSGPPVPGTALWRWTVNDEGMWERCIQRRPSHDHRLAGTGLVGYVLYKLYILSQPFRGRTRLRKHAGSKSPSAVLRGGRDERTRSLMEHISTAEARKNMAELVNRAAYGGERFVVTRHGKELVAIVPVEDATLLDRLRGLLEKRDYEAALREIAETGTVPWADVRRELDL